MDNKFIDLHIHSYYSDGTMSPQEIIEEALASNVGVIAITDHNVLEGSRELLQCAKTKDIQCLTGVELDTLDDDINYHILGYGFDVDNEIFNARVKKNNDLLESVNEQLIIKMEKINPLITLAEYQQFTYNRRFGGWKALHYFQYKGLTHSLFEGFRLYKEYGHSYTCVGFPPIAEVCKWIHEAGGIAILAHPYRVIKEDDSDILRSKIENLLSKGLDGIECYYPDHSDQVTKICLDICRNKGLRVTSGADCHGDFEDTVIGQMRTHCGQVDWGG